MAIIIDIVLKDHFCGLFVFNRLFSLKKHNKNEVVTAFSGLLEMSRRSKVVTEQDELFGDIEVEKSLKK